MGQPARNYKWKNFEPGNLAGMRHGGFSRRKIEEHAQQLRELLAARLPYLADEVFEEAMVRYCTAQARYLLLNDYVMAKAEADGVASVPAYLWQETARSEANAAKFAQDLGLDARGHSAIARDLGMARSIAARFSETDGLGLIGVEGRKLRQLRGRT